MDDETADSIRERTLAMHGTSKVSWLRVDKTIEMPPVGPEYGEIMVARLTKCLMRLQADGTLGDDAIVRY